MSASERYEPVRRRGVRATLLGVGVEKDMVRFRGTKEGWVAEGEGARAHDMYGKQEKGEDGGRSRRGVGRKTKGEPPGT